MATGFKNLTSHNFFNGFNKRSEEIGRLFNHIIQNHEKYI